MIRRVWLQFRERAIDPAVADVGPTFSSKISTPAPTLPVPPRAGDLGADHGLDQQLAEEILERHTGARFRPTDFLKRNRAGVFLKTPARRRPVFTPGKPLPASKVAEIGIDRPVTREVSTRSCAAGCDRPASHKYRRPEVPPCARRVGLRLRGRGCPAAKVSSIWLAAVTMRQSTSSVPGAQAASGLTISRTSGRQPSGRDANSVLYRQNEPVRDATCQARPRPENPDLTPKMANGTIPRRFGRDWCATSQCGFLATLWSGFSCLLDRHIF